MRLIWSILLAFVCVTPLTAQVQGAVRAELRADKARYFAGERIELRLRLSLDREFRTKNLVQLFRRSLDVPASLEAPWLQESPRGWVFERPDLVRTPGRSFAVSGQSAQLARLEPEAGRDVYEWRSVLFVAEPGVVRLAGARLRFAYATKFREDLFDDRVAENRFEDALDLAPLNLEVVSLPEAGRPADWRGAIGRFEIDATVAAEELKVGDELILTLQVRGEGNLSRFEAPDLGSLPGFHQLAVEEVPRAGERMLRYALEPLRPMTSFPALRLPYFDPQKEEYAVARSQVVSLVVVGDSVEPEGKGPKLLPITGAWRQPANEAGDPTLALLGLLLPWLIFVGAIVGRSIWRGQQVDPEVERIHEAVGRLLATSAEDEADFVELWSEYLGARLRCPSAAVITPDLARRLFAAGVPDALAQRCSELMDQLVRARYRRAPSAEFVAQERDLVGELEHAFQAQEE